MNRDIYLALRDLVTVHSQSPALELIFALAGLGGNIAHSAQGRRSPRKVSDRVCFDWRLTLVQPGHYGRRRNILESLLPSPQRDRIEHANWFPAAGVVASRTQLRRVPAFTKEAICAYAAANIVPGCFSYAGPRARGWRCDGPTSETLHSKGDLGCSEVGGALHVADHVGLLGDRVSGQMSIASSTSMPR